MTRRRTAYGLPYPEPISVATSTAMRANRRTDTLPERELRSELRRLLDLDFDSLLFAHGEPLVGGAEAALREFLADG